MTYPTFGGSGSGFLLGIADNLFGAAGQTGDARVPSVSVTAAATRTIAETTRDTYFTANPTNLTNYDNNPERNIRLVYLDSGNEVIIHQVRQGDSWVDNGSVTGVPGRDGTDGMGALDQSIELGTVLRVGESGGTRVPVASSAVETDAGIAVSKMLMTRPGGLQLGEQGGTIISAATDDITYRNVSDEDHIVLSQIYDRVNGTSKPTRLDFGAAEIFSAANGTGTTLTGKHTISFTTVARGFTRAIRFRPQSAGTFNLKVFLGTEAAGKILADVDIEIAAGDVGTLVDTDTRVFTPGDSPAGQMYSFVLDGVSFDGGVSSSPVTDGQTLPYMDTVFHAASDIELLDRLDFTAADEAKLDNITAFFRGNYSSVATYQHGDIVRSNYEGRPAMYISAAAQLPDTALPETKLDTGFWFLLTDRTWRGSWAARDYVPGQLVTNGGELWASVQTIGVGDTNPPSTTNSAWEQVSGGGGVTVEEEGTALATVASALNFTGDGVTATGTGTTKTINIPGTSGMGAAPIFDFRRQNTTLPSTTADNTHVVIDDTGSSLITITMPDSDGTFIDRRITVINGRPGANVRVAFAAGDTLQDGFDNFIDLIPGQSVTVATGEANNWVTVSEGSTRVAPQFAANPENDDNTFFFAVNGDTPSTWRRDMGTTIDMRSDNSTVGYELANPATNGISIADGEGYTFRHTTGTNSVTIAPFAATNRFFIGGTEYTNASPYNLPLNNSVVVLYNTTTNRWEGRTFSFLLPVGASGAGAGGASGSTGGSEMGSMLTQGVYVNESGEDLVAGDGVHLDALDGSRAFTKGSIADDNQLRGFLLEDVANNSAGTVSLFGNTPMPVISRSTTAGARIGAPLTAGTRLYWDEGPIGFKGFVTIDDQASEVVPNYQVGRVLDSSWLYPTDEFTSNRIISDQAGWDNAINKVHVKNFVGGGEIEIPDLAEGSSEATAVAGQRLIVHVANGGGDVSIRPRGASTIAPHSSTTGSTYDNSTPLPITGGNSDEYIIIEVNAAANSYVSYALNSGGLNTNVFFDPLDYVRRRLAGQVSSLSATVDTNSADIDNLENDVVIPVVVASYTASIQNVMYIVNPTSNTSNTITIAGTANWTVQANRTIRMRVRNSSNQFWLKVDKGTGFNEFEGTSIHELWMAPGETWEFLIWNDGSWHIEKPGRIAYDFEFENGVFTGSGSPTWAAPVGIPTLPTEIVEVPGANQDRITIKYDAVIQNCRLDTQYSFSGTAAADFASLVSLTPSLNIRVNTTTVGALPDTTVPNITNGKAHVGQEVKMFPISANEYINLTGTDFTDINALSTSIRGSIVVKMA